MFNEPSQPLHANHPVLSKARLSPYFLEDAVKPACMLVIPGGGYGNISHQEGPPVAGWFNSMGIAAVVLEYTVNRVTAPEPELYPQPQQQALYAMRYLRANAEALNIDPARIGVIGFSAGGHLCACVSQGFDREDWLLDPDHTLGGISARPDASILCYAVLSGGAGHIGSYFNLLGKDINVPKDTEFLSWEKHVNPNSPPTFLWHTAADDCVPVENSYLMAMALRANGTPHELHVFPDGKHGLGLVSIGDRRQPGANQWRTLAENWLMRLGF
jgi:acetyl esterase/lipase